MNGPIRWAAVPPPKRSRVYAELVSPVSRAGFCGICLAPEIVGVFTHYQDGRTRPCAGSECWCHREGRQPRWKGYMPILLFPGEKTCLFEITENAASQMLPWFDPKEGLRGVHFHAKRRTNKSRSPVDVERKPYTYAKFLPVPFDPVPVLLNLWGVRVQFTDGVPGQAGADRAGKAGEQ